MYKNRIIILIITLVLIYYLKYNEPIDNILNIYYYHLIHILYKIFKRKKTQQINESISLCIADNKKYYIFNYDTIISGHLSFGIPWEKFMHKYFIKYSDINMNALDIGANIGTHTIYLAENFQYVYAFEPQKEVFKLLNSNIKINNISNVITYNYGLGNEDKNVNMIKYDVNKSENIGAIKIDDKGDGEQIIVKTLDSFNFINIKFIKMDVEGYEYFVLLGGINTILQSKPIIIIELNKHGSKYRKDIDKFFKDINYKLKRISHDDYLAEPNE